jgi:hypothetical protein
VVTPESPSLAELVDAFAVDWLQIADPDVGPRVVADPILVLGPDGTSAIPREAFLAAVVARQAAVDAAPAARTSAAVERTVHQLGERIVLATISWRFEQAGDAALLVGDFLLERWQDGLRCVAYLPRTNVMTHITS